MKKTSTGQFLNFRETLTEFTKKRIAALLHDPGKICIPTVTLNKPIKLSKIEYSLIKDHPQVGYDILKSIDFSYPVVRIVLGRNLSKQRYSL